MPGICPAVNASSAQRLAQLKQHVMAAGIFANPAGAPLLLNCFISLGNVKVVRRLIEGRPGYADESDWHGWTSLHVAVHSGHRKMITIFFERRPGMLDLEDKNGRTPLQLAVAFGRVEIIRHLIGLGAKVDGKSPGWRSLLEWLIIHKMGLREVIKVVFEAGGGARGWKDAVRMVKSAIPHGEPYEFIVLPLLERIRDSRHEIATLFGGSPEARHVPAILEEVIRACQPSARVLAALLDIESSLYPNITATRRNAFEHLFQYARRKGHSDIVQVIMNSKTMEYVSWGPFIFRRKRIPDSGGFPRENARLPRTLTKKRPVGQRPAVQMDLQQGARSEAERLTAASIDMNREGPPKEADDVWKRGMGFD